MQPFRRLSLVLVQAAGALLGLAVLMAWPPAQGPMMLVALPGVTGSDMVNAVLRGGGAVLGSGPLPGSIVVTGDRARIVAEASPHAVLVLAAPPTGCGPRDGTTA